jgi:hypothetical protein
VVLEHSGWQAFGDPAAARAEYEHGWPMVLGRYRDHAGSRRSQDQAQTHTWVALLHRPRPDAPWVALLHRGPDAPPDGTVFDDPRFAEHIAFLRRMHDAGHLVAAGPLTDNPATA